MFFTNEPEEDYYYDARPTYEDAVANSSGKYVLTIQGTAICVRDQGDKSPTVIKLDGSSVVRQGR